MKRTNFYNKVVVDDHEELDFLWNSLSDFKMTYEPTYYRVAHADVMRPDLISYKVYGVVEFWWIICLVNNINSPLTEIEAGHILKIPNQVDIYNFQRLRRVRRTR